MLAFPTVFFGRVFGDIIVLATIGTILTIVLTPYIVKYRVYVPKVFFKALIKRERVVGYHGDLEFGAYAIYTKHSFYASTKLSLSLFFHAGNLKTLIYRVPSDIWNFMHTCLALG